MCDEERHIVRLVEVNLRRQGCEVATAFTWEECLAQVRSFLPDLVIVDRKLPGMSEEELRRVLRENPQTTDAEILVLGKDENRRGGGPPTTGKNFLSICNPLAKRRNRDLEAFSKST